MHPRGVTGPVHAIDSERPAEGDAYVRDGDGWRRVAGGPASFDRVTPCDWVARRYPAPAVRGPGFGPGADDTELWGKTEAEAHEWLRTQRGWLGYVITRVPGSDR